VAISLFNFLLKSKKAFSGITLEIETGLHYLKENRYSSYPLSKEEDEKENIYFLFVGKYGGSLFLMVFIRFAFRLSESKRKH